MSDDVRTATVRTLWDDAASIYQDVMEPALREPHLSVRALAGDVDGLDTLDLGCGTGAMSELLGPAGARVTAVDLAPHMVAVARERLAGVPGIVGVEVMDAQALDLPDASFDLVVAALSLMFCPDHPAAFAEVHRVLRPGGRLVMACWGRSHECESVTVGRVAAAFATGSTPPGTPTGQSLGDPEQLRGLLEGAGFDDVVLIRRGVRLRYPGPDALWAAVRHVHGERIPAERMDDARTATMAEIARVGLPLRNTGWLATGTA